MTTIFKSHITYSLSSPPMHLSSSPPATPSTASKAKSRYRRDFEMPSPSNTHSRSVTSITPRSCRLTNIYTTPSSGSRRDLAPMSTSHCSRSKVKFSARQTKPNPLVPSRESYCGDEERATRRILFLNRVKEAGEEKRWRERNGGFGEGDEEVMRALWLAEKRRWQEQQRREASGQVFPAGFEELEETQSADKDGIGLEDFLNEEDLTLSNLYLAQNADQTKNSMYIKSRKIYTCDDDDDEYDHIFMEVIQQENETSNSLMGCNENSVDHDEMDMS